MIELLAAWQLLAQDGNGGDGVNPFLQMLPMILAIGFLWYFLLVRPQRREQARRQELLNQLKKNDRVVTIGGIVGTVAGFSQEGKSEYVTLKVDDNTRIKMLRTAIQGPLREGDQEKDTSSARDAGKDS